MQPKASDELVGCLADVVRGGVVESRHMGNVAVVDGAGTLVAKVGNPDTVTFLRSSAKPFQSIPLVSSGAADRFGFSNQEIAIACGSHNGEPLHTQTVESMLRKIGLSSADLKCGLHEHYDKMVANEQKRFGQPPHVLQNNCSGKHAGMLCLARHLDVPIATYISLQHPVQELSRAAVAEFAGVASDLMPGATDGCGIPTFALPLRTMASMFAQLVCRTQVSDNSAAAAKRIVEAMTAHPEYVGADHEFDTELMRKTHGRIISKMGAEGMWCAGVLPDRNGGRGLGIAIKIGDGSARARSLIAIEVLNQLQLLSTLEVSALSHFSNSAIRNNRGEIVGSVQPTVRLVFP